MNKPELSRILDLIMNEESEKASELLHKWFIIETKNALETSRNNLEDIQDDDLDRIGSIKKDQAEIKSEEYFGEDEEGDVTQDAELEAESEIGNDTDFDSNMVDIDQDKLQSLKSKFDDLEKEFNDLFSNFESTEEDKELAESFNLEIVKVPNVAMEVGNGKAISSVKVKDAAGSDKKVVNFDLEVSPKVEKITVTNLGNGNESGTVVQGLPKDSLLARGNAALAKVKK